MKNRSLIYWMISIPALLCCLLFSSNHNTQTTTATSLSSLIKVEPGYIFYTGSKYHLKIPGELKVQIKLDQLKEQLLKFNTLIIEELSIGLNTRISLNWIINEQTFSQPLNHTSYSVNKFDLQTKNIDDITELFLLFKTRTELGTSASHIKEVTYKSISLDHDNNLNTLSTHISEWFDFTPIEVKSINGFSSNNDPHLQSLIYRLSLWLLICMALYLSLKVKGVHFISCFALAWLLSSVPFLNNFLQQHQQIKSSFEDNSDFINLTDKDAYRVANEIIKQSNTIDSIDVRKDKFVLLGPADFWHLRLFHYLDHLDIGFISFWGETDLLKHNNVIFILFNRKYLNCDTLNQAPFNHMTVLYKQNNFCMLRTP